MGKYSINRILPYSGQFFVLPSKSLSVCTRHFKLSENLPMLGQLLRVNLAGKTASPKAKLEIEQEIIKKNKNSLLIWTTPTQRLKSDYDDCIYPGHNFSSVTDDNGETACSMSKRPDTTSMIGERKRIPDPRFKNQCRTTRLFSPRYPSVQEELIQWLKRAAAAPEYPLFVHVLPLHPPLEVNLASYRSNVELLRSLQEPYSLFSFLHPCGDRYIRAGNCNAATEQSIFGANSASIQDLSCQEAAMKIVTRLLKTQHDYLNAADDLGLTQGIEPSTISEDLYQSSFTC